MDEEKAFKLTKRYKKEISVYCAWCKKHMKGPCVGYKGANISHSICEQCKLEIEREIDIKMNKIEKEHDKNE